LIPYEKEALNVKTLQSNKKIFTYATICNKKLKIAYFLLFFNSEGIIAISQSFIVC